MERESPTPLAVSRKRAAFTLAELLVVIGVISLLIAIVLPPLEMARAQAMRTKCSAQLQQLGVALIAARHQFGYYPLWDDGSSDVRFTWVDVLIQQRFYSSRNGAYCPEDLGPDPINEGHGRALGLRYPGKPGSSGIDYSYGIGVPLSAGGWAWQPGYGRNDGHRRRFEGSELNTSGRVLAGDSTWSWIYNFNSEGWPTQTWNLPTWYDNTVAWRHGGSANVLKQDGHVERVVYDVSAARHVDTQKHFVWYPDEPLDVGPDSRHGQMSYPDETPPSFQTSPRGSTFPNDMLPAYYTRQKLWTLISHKQP